MRLLRKKNPQISDRAGRYGRKPDVFSYHASRSASTGPALPKRKFSWTVIPTVLAIGMIIFSVGYFLTLETSPRVVILGGSDQATLLQDVEVYQRTSEEILAGSILNRSKLTINTDTTAEELKKSFPEIREVAITIPIASHKLVFELQPATPTAVLGSGSAGPFVIDEEGRAVIRASEVPSLQKLGLPIIQDESGLELKLGEFVLRKEEIAFIASVNEQFKAKSVVIESMTLPALPNELHVRIKGENYLVKFDVNGDARQQSGALFAVRQKLKSQGRKPSQYIDVRVKDKVFYK